MRERIKFGNKVNTKALDSRLSYVYCYTNFFAVMLTMSNGLCFILWFLTISFLEQDFEEAAEKYSK